MRVHSVGNTTIYVFKGAPWSGSDVYVPYTAWLLVKPLWCAGRCLTGAMVNLHLHHSMIMFALTPPGGPLLDALGVGGPRVWGHKGGGVAACRQALGRLGTQEASRAALQLLLYQTSEDESGAVNTGFECCQRCRKVYT